MEIVSPVEVGSGAGELRGIRLPGHEGPPPLRVVVGETLDIEVDYLPVTNHDPIRMAVTAESEGVDIEVLRADVGSFVLAAVETTVRHPVTVPSELASRRVTLRIELGSGGVTEVCVKVPAEVSRHDAAANAACVGPTTGAGSGSPAVDPSPSARANASRRADDLTEPQPVPGSDQPQHQGIEL